MEKYIRKIKLQRNTMWGCKMDSAGCASFWIRPRTRRFHKISNISEYLSDCQICKDSVPWNFSFNHVQAWEYLYLATICNFYSSPRAKPPVFSHLYQYLALFHTGILDIASTNFCKLANTRFPSMFKLFSPFDTPTDDPETTFLSELSSYVPYKEDLLAQDKV